VATLKKTSDDGGGGFAAVLSYYGFLSLFPLLLLAISILGFIVQSNASALKAIEHSGLPNIALVGDTLKHGHLRGSGIGLAVGALGTLWGGLAITLAVQNAFNQIVAVPYDRRPNFIKLRLRGLRLLVTVGTLEIVATTIAGVMSGGLTPRSGSRWPDSPSRSPSTSCSSSSRSASSRMRRCQRAPCGPGSRLLPPAGSSCSRSAAYTSHTC